ARGYATPEAETIFLRAQALCEQLQEAPPLFTVLWGLWVFYDVSSDARKSRELAERLFTLAQSGQEPDRFLQAHQALVVTSLWRGEPADTREHMEQAVALYDPRRHHSHTPLYGRDPPAPCPSFGAVALWLLGYPEQAAQRSRAAVALGEQLGHPGTLALALYFAGMLRQYRHEAQGVRKTAEDIMAIATEHKLSFWGASAQILGGWALAEQGVSA